MKAYVDELPKGCLSCPYIVDKGDYDLCAIKDCVIDDAFKYIDKRKKSCPLLSLSDYTKQVRKEVCEEIREICKLNIRTYKIQSQDDCERYKEVDAFNKAIFGVLEILDQIEQGKQND